MNILKTHLNDTTQIRNYRFWWLLCLAGLSAFLISNVLAFAAAQVVISQFTDNFEQVFAQYAPYINLLQGVLMAIFCVGVVWLHNGFKLYKKDFMTNSLAPMHLLKWVILGFILVYGFNYVSEQIFPWLKQDSNTVLKAFGFGKSMWHDAATIATIGILAPVSEELAYRGLILKMMRDGLSKTKWFNNTIYNKTYIAALIAIAVSAFFFATLHAGEGQQSAVPFLFVNALIFGFLYIKTKSLYVPVLVHSLNNSVVIIVMTLSSSEISLSSSLLYIFAAICPIISYFAIKIIQSVSH